VAPPEACVPDDIEPIVKGGTPYRFDRYGMRVPLIAIGPHVKRHYVSHNVYSHSSILRFLATKFNFPALTRRDANADPMLDLFDFKNPDFSIPKLPAADINWKKVRACFKEKHLIWQLIKEEVLGDSDSDDEDEQFKTASET
jgi:phospholipase C